MKKRILSFALILAMLLTMSTAVFAADWETPIDVVQVAMVGDEYYASLDAAFAAANGAEVSLSADVTVDELVVPAEDVLNLNGYTLTANSVDVTAASAYIIDTTGGEGLLVVNGEYDFGENAPYLPIKDETAGGFRFFEVEVKSVAVSGKNSAGPKYWFQVNFANFAKVKTLLSASSEVTIKVNLSVDGTEAVANADGAFLMKWVEAYEANNDIYITAQLVGDEVQAGIVAKPGIGANGVDVLGDNM